MDLHFKLFIILPFLVFYETNQVSGVSVSELKKLIMQDMERRDNMYPKVHVEDKATAVENSEKSNVEGDMARMLNLMMKQYREVPDYIRQRSWFTDDGAVRGTSDKYGNGDVTIPTTTPPTSTTEVDETTSKPTINDFWKFWIIFNKLFKSTTRR
ncbi:hypothetical protein ACF0H5_023606 [Mactra antiquata]